MIHDFWLTFCDQIGSNMTFHWLFDLFFPKFASIWWKNLCFFVMEKTQQAKKEVLAEHPTYQHLYACRGSERLEKSGSSIRQQKVERQKQHREMFCDYSLLLHLDTQLKQLQDKMNNRKEKLQHRKDQVTKTRHDFGLFLKKIHDGSKLTESLDRLKDKCSHSFKKIVSI